MDITKYLTNKEVVISNDDLNIEKLEKDIRKGYVLSDEVETARKEALKESAATYTELEEKYNKLEKSYNDIEARNTELTTNKRALEQKVEMVSLGFKKEDFDEVSKLRNSIYADEQDDVKAFTNIKERYRGTYFPEEKQPVNIPNETSFNVQQPKPQQEAKVTRKTSIKELFIK